MKPHKNSHDIAKVTHYSGRSANISPLRLRIEQLMESTGMAYSSQMLAEAVGTTTHNASRILREMRKASTARFAGKEPVRGKPMYCHYTARLPLVPRAEPAQPSALRTAATSSTAAQQVAGPRIYTNSAQPNGSQEYWRRALAWGRTT